VFGLASGNKKRLIIVEEGEASTIHFGNLMKPVSRASIMSSLARKELTAFVARAFLPTSMSDSRAGTAPDHRADTARSFDNGGHSVCNTSCRMRLCHQ
jgi:hypothetical protein